MSEVTFEASKSPPVVESGDAKELEPLNSTTASARTGSPAPSDPLPRSVILGVPTAPGDYPSNVVITSRYTVLTFLPYNLWEQFQLKSNIYFAFIAVLQVIPPISTTGGFPSIVFPLMFILAVSGLRAAIEDYRRHVSDREENNLEYKTFNFQTKKFEAQTSGHLKVGDVIFLQRNQSIPADSLILRSADPRGHVFVETASLDGETSLKVKTAVPFTHDVVFGDEDIPKLEGLQVKYEGANAEFEQFKAKCSWKDVAINLEPVQLLLRGTVLKNTEYLYAMVLYTGSDTKIRQQNAAINLRKVKNSSIQNLVNRYLVYMFVLQFVLCLVGGIWSAAAFESFSSHWYLQVANASSGGEFFLRFFTWIILLAQLVPISYQVSSEVVKTFQAFFITEDLRIYEYAAERRTAVQSSSLNDDLGQIQYIFSDKTGTLTQNRMQFRVAFVGASNQYGSAETEISKRVQARLDKSGRNTDSNARDASISLLPGSKLISPEKMAEDQPRWIRLAEELEKAQRSKFGSNIDLCQSPYVNIEPHTRDRLLDDAWGESEASTDVQLFLLHMAISNTITPIMEETPGKKEEAKLVYQSSSPDELALCSFARLVGYELVKRNPTTVKIDKYGKGENVEESYALLATLDFNSKRKRVTMIYEKIGEGKIYVMCKGADSALWPLMKNTAPVDESLMNEQLAAMSNNGLRTLLIAHGDQTYEWWEKWKPIWDDISSLPERGDEKHHTKGGCSDNCRICFTMRDLELDAGLRLLGATAIEDQLQELVPEAIADFLDAGIKVWMLTGDKRETAKNIALACNLIDPDMDPGEPDSDVFQLLGEELESGPKSPPGSGTEEFCESQQNRLIEVTGNLAHTLQSKEALQSLFNSWDADSDGIISGRHYNILLKALKISRVRPDALIPKSEIITKITAEEFIDRLSSLQITAEEVVADELKSGLELANSIPDLNQKPVSLVIEGSALGTLYPVDEEVKKKKVENSPKTKMGLDMVIPTIISLGTSSGVIRHGTRRESPEVKESEAEKRLRLLRDMLFDLASKCKSVVACRLTPFQKATMVREVKNRKKVITLAIGDGANDEQMIREANVGIGVAGVEGTAASRAADYVIGKFRYLHTLLFVHGNWNYNRMASLTHYIFYKTSLLSFAGFYLGFLQSFSGTQYFEDSIFQLYNILFTALPVMALGIFDRRLSRKVLEDYPIAYRSLLKGDLFNGKTFFGWILAAAIHAALVVLINVISVGNQNVSSKDGKTTGIWFLSTTVYSSIVIIATLQVAFEMHSITAIHHLSVWGSFILYFIVILVISVLYGISPDFFGTAERLLSSGAFWFSFILAVSVTLLSTMVVKSFYAVFRPSELHKLAHWRNETRRLRKARLIKEIAMKQNNPKLTLHTDRLAAASARHLPEVDVDEMLINVPSGPLVRSNTSILVEKDPQQGVSLSRTMKIFKDVSTKMDSLGTSQRVLKIDSSDSGYERKSVADLKEKDLKEVLESKEKDK